MLKVVSCDPIRPGASFLSKTEVQLFGDDEVDIGQEIQVWLARQQQEVRNCTMIL